MSDFFDKSKITKFNSCLFLDEHIFRLDIPVEEAMSVDIVKRRSYLLDNVPDLLVAEGVVV